MIEQFINRFQQTKYNQYDEFLVSVENYSDNPRTYQFLKLGLIVLKSYEKNLIKENQLDFNQLLLKACSHIDDGLSDDFILDLKWILIDEYQDFSQLYLNLIESIRNRNKEIKLFCVGDNWQAINRFAGSDTKYFDNFNYYFDNTKFESISSNYRSNADIVNNSNKFMSQNGFGGKLAYSKIERTVSKGINYIDIDKCYINAKDKVDKILIDQFLSRNGNYTYESDYLSKSKYLKECFKIVVENKNKRSILILHRNNEFKFKDIKNFKTKLISALIKNKIFNSKKELFNKIIIKTMHSSKGIEAEVVIILDVTQGVIPLNHPDVELYEIFGEDKKTNMDDQMRLFYVAITRAKERLYILYEGSSKSEFLNVL